MQDDNDAVNFWRNGTTIGTDSDRSEMKLISTSAAEEISPYLSNGWISEERVKLLKATPSYDWLE